MQALGKSGGFALFLCGSLRHLYRCPAGRSLFLGYALLLIKNAPSVSRHRGVIIWRYCFQSQQFGYRWG